MTVSRHAAVYVRISSDPSGKRLGVARQLKDCRGRAQARGWTVAGVYEDNDISAFTGKRRPAYERMLADLEVGRADAVVVWDLDRLTRRPIELEHFLDLADRKRIALASVGGDVDLSTDNGRLYARIKGAVARAEIERKSARQRAANDQRAEQGRPHCGRRPFGYTSAYEVDDAEAPEIHRAVESLLAGGSLRGIVKDMAARGVLTTAGNPWKPTELRRLLVNPRYAGLRVHRGEVVGTAAWPAIIDQDAHKAVCAILSDPSRHKAGRPRRYLLSGLARCGVCGGSIYGVTEPRGPLYYCETRRHVARRAEQIEELVSRVVIERLSRPDAADLLTAQEDNDTADELRSEERGIRARLDGLAEAFAVGDIDRDQMRAGSKRLHQRLDSVTAGLATLARTPVLTGLLSADVASVWESMDIDTRRSVVDTVLHVILDSPGRGARRFDPTTVRISWKS